MEKKKITKKVEEQPKKVAETKVSPKVKRVKDVAPAEVKVEPVAVVEETPKAVVKEKRPITLNQDLNLLIGLLSLMTIVTFCFAFQGGESEILGWELFLNAKNYSSVLQGLMVIYVASIFIDCILAIHVDSESEIFNIIEKILYMFTLVINFIIIAVLLSLISKIGLGLIIFLILSIVSAIIKLVRIYAKNK